MCYQLMILILCDLDLFDRMHVSSTAILCALLPFYTFVLLKSQKNILFGPAHNKFAMNNAFDANQLIG